MTRTSALYPALASAMVVVTRSINVEMKRNLQFREAVKQSVARFEMLDWGETCAGKIYIIADPSADGRKYRYITVLYPSDY